MPARPRSARLLARWGGLALAAALLASRPAPLAAQDWLLLGGLANVEGWATDSGSTLLTHNNGHPGPLGQLYLWAGVALPAHLQLVSVVEGHAGDASQDGSEIYLQESVVRFRPSPAVGVVAGKFPSPVGAYANRRLPNANPLIGDPDAYPTAYPWGAEAVGIVGSFDYRAALVSLPVTRAGYLPDPTPALRPAVGAGFTPLIGLRLGASFTVGPYLNDTLAGTLLAGRTWSDYHQRIAAFDAEFSRGYAELHAELALSSYDVPGRTGTVNGYAYYGELKYTWTPRLYTAVRLEQNNYPFIQPLGGAWVARTTNMYNGEAGVGYRLSQAALVKLSFRKDAHWGVDPAVRYFVPDGNALAAQFCYTFDVVELLRGAR